jgi:hypothetical protein
MLLQDADYRAELKKVVEQIKDSTTLIDIRGEGEAQFIYAANEFRSLEVSQCNNGVWIEFWNNDNEIPVKEETVHSYEEAAIVSLNWLNSCQ